MYLPISVKISPCFSFIERMSILLPLFLVWFSPFYSSTFGTSNRSVLFQDLSFISPFAHCARVTYLKLNLCSLPRPNVSSAQSQMSVPETKSSSFLHNLPPLNYAISFINHMYILMVTSQPFFCRNTWTSRKYFIYDFKLWWCYLPFSSVGINSWTVIFWGRGIMSPWSGPSSQEGGRAKIPRTRRKSTVRIQLIRVQSPLSDQWIHSSFRFFLSEWKFGSPETWAYCSQEAAVWDDCPFWWSQDKECERVPPGRQQGHRWPSACGTQMNFLGCGPRCCRIVFFQLECHCSHHRACCTVPWVSDSVGIGKCLM